MDQVDQADRGGDAVQIDIFEIKTTHRVGYKAEDMLPKAYHRSHEPAPNTAPTTSDNPDPLIAQALIARSRSFVPRTNEPVGAAVETTSGHIYKGVQVETSSFSTLHRA